MGWTSLTSIKGPKGDAGPTGPEGGQGIQGPPGADGAGIEIAGSVAAYGDLPTTLGTADVGDGYLVQADGKLYIWTGTEFPANGQGVEFRGPLGPQGIQGETGPTGPEGAKGDQGDRGPAGPNGEQGPKGDKGETGDQGLKGDKGDKGDTGTAGTNGARGTLWYWGNGSPQDGSAALSGSQLGDLYLDMDTGLVWTLS